MMKDAARPIVIAGGGIRRMSAALALAKRGMRARARAAAEIQGRSGPGFSWGRLLARLARLGVEDAGKKVAVSRSPGHDGFDHQRQVVSFTRPASKNVSARP